MIPAAAYTFARMWSPAMEDSDGNRFLIPGEALRYRRRDALAAAARHIAAVEAEIAQDMAP